MSAVVLAYGDEPWLERCVHALLASTQVAVEVVLVDNGCTDGGVGRLRDTPGVVQVGTGTNLGFSGSAMLDPFTARTIRDQPADLISLKLGINLVNGDAMRMRTDWGPG